MPIVRKAELKDYEQVLRLKRQVHALHANACPDFYKNSDLPLTKRQYEMDLHNDMVEVYVLSRDRDVLGYAVASTRIVIDHPLVVTQKIMYIEDFCIDQQHQSRGLGTLFFRGIEEQAREDGYTSIELDVWEFNQAAQMFYKKMGMECCRHRLRKQLKNP